jgi:hypothetical protein
VITVANVQTQVILLVGRFMDLVGIYGGVPQAGSPLTSPYMNMVIRDSYQRMGYGISDPSGLTIVDTDLAVFDVRALRRLMEWCELYILDQVERDWNRISIAEMMRTHPELDQAAILEMLQSMLSKIRGRLTFLRVEVTKPYQSMNVPISVGQIRRGSVWDCSLPPSVANVVPPWALAPDGLWFYGYDYWGWGQWGDWGFGSWAPWCETGWNRCEPC